MLKERDSICTQEEIRNDYEIERILHIEGDKCLILWQHYDDLTWEEQENVEQLDMYKTFVEEMRKKQRAEKKDG